MCLTAQWELIVVMIPNTGGRVRTTKLYTQSLGYPRYESRFVTRLGMFRF
jgi:hypothetical protein